MYRTHNWWGRLCYLAGLRDSLDPESEADLVGPFGWCFRVGWRGRVLGRARGALWGWVNGERMQEWMGDFSMLLCDTQAMAQCCFCQQLMSWATNFQISVESLSSPSNCYQNKIQQPASTITPYNLPAAKTVYVVQLAGFGIATNAFQIITSAFYSCLLDNMHAWQSLLRLFHITPYLSDKWPQTLFCFVFGDWVSGIRTTSWRTN